MKRVVLSTAASLAAMTVVAAPAAAAINLGPTEIILVEDGETLTGSFGESGIGDEATGFEMFEANFFFTLEESGFTVGTISTSTVVVNSLTDVDLTEVLLNGVAFDLTGPGRSEMGDLPPNFFEAGIQELIVRGNTRGNGSFAGTIAFVPSAAVPEPGTWALMLLGFAAVGFTLRRRKPETRETRVRYDFA